MYLYQERTLAALRLYFAVWLPKEMELVHTISTMVVCLQVCLLLASKVKNFLLLQWFFFNRFLNYLNFLLYSMVYGLQELVWSMKSSIWLIWLLYLEFNFRFGPFSSCILSRVLMETYLPWSLFTSVKSNIDLYYYDCFSCMTEMYSLFSCYSNRWVLFVKYLVEFIELLLWGLGILIFQEMEENIQ